MPSSCTKCQLLNHTFKACRATRYRCSWCSKFHPREKCTEVKPNCVNCSGNHSSAYKYCPKQEELRKSLTYRARCYSPSALDVDLFTDNQFDPSAQKGTNQSKLDQASSDASQILSDKGQGEKLTSPIASDSQGQRFINREQCPSFLQFVLSTVKPILNMSSNTRAINQLAQIYYKTYQLKEDVYISDEDKSDAEGILGIPKSDSHSYKPKTNGLCPSPVTNVTSQSHSLQSLATDTMKSPCQTKSKQLSELENLTINNDTENIVIGDSILKNVDEESIISTQVFSISGLTLEDSNTWAKQRVKNMKVKKVIMHVGINSCKTKAIGVQQWIAFIVNIKLCFPNAEVFLSCMIPALGNRTKFCNESNATVKEACRSCNIQYIDHYNTFKPHGSVRKSLYRYNDKIHPSIKGSALLSQTLFNYLHD